jgi:hypothetical protein
MINTATSAQKIIGDFLYVFNNNVKKMRINNEKYIKPHSVNCWINQLSGM